MLKVEGLSMHYQQGDSIIKALSNVSFCIERGESVAVIGPSGSGKTTLLTLLAGLDRPFCGRVLFNKTDLTQMTEKQMTQFRSQNIGIIFQYFHLMPYLTAIENIMLPLEINGDFDSKEKAENMIKMVGLIHRRNHYPHQLSGGECQRVAIARAAVFKPQLLLADEPSGNLDKQTGDYVIDLLFDLVRETQLTMVLVTHNESLAQRCTNKIELVGGQIK